MGTTSVEEEGGLSITLDRRVYRAQNQRELGITGGEREVWDKN
jgi:hypothetical protein